MGPLINCIINKDTRKNPIWLMRQAGRYLPEFRKIRKENQDFSLEIDINKFNFLKDISLRVSNKGIF